MQDDIVKWIDTDSTYTQYKEYKDSIKSKKAENEMLNKFLEEEWKTLSDNTLLELSKVKKADSKIVEKINKWELTSWNVVSDTYKDVKASLDEWQDLSKVKACDDIDNLSCK